MTDPRLRIDTVTRARYSQGAGIYRIIPAAVARPESAAELTALLAYAREKGLSVTPRGAGSAMDGSSVGAGLVLDLAGFNRASCLINPEQRSATVGAGTTCDDLAALAAVHALRLPPDPSSSRWATFGGMVSTNASGARSLRYGSIRRWISGLMLHTTDGDLVLRRGETPDASHPAVARWRSEGAPVVVRHRDAIRARYPKVRKNSAGYALDQYLATGDLLDLVIGSEGTLGVIGEVHLRLEPIPAHRASVRVLLRSRDDLAPAIDAIRAQDPTTLEFLDSTFLHLIDRDALLPECAGMVAGAGGLLLADVEGDTLDDVHARAALAIDASRDFALDARLATDAAEIERLWRVRHGASPVLAGLTDGRRSLQVIEDGCVPPARLAEYLVAVEAACRAERIDAVMFGHAGDGHVHVNLLPNLREPDWRDRVRQIFAAVTDAVIRLGGTPSGEHGAGRLRAGTLEQVYGADMLECFRAVKHAFDPAGLFNPGVIIPDTADPFTRLKVGANAATLPAGLEEYLTRIEADARWGESRWE